MIEDFLKLGGGFGTIMHGQIGFAAHIRIACRINSEAASRWSSFKHWSKTRWSANTG